MLNIFQIKFDYLNENFQKLVLNLKEYFDSSE